MSRAATILLAVALVAASCGDQGSESASDPATTTTAPDSPSTSSSLPEALEGGDPSDPEVDRIRECVEAAGLGGVFDDVDTRDELRERIVGLSDDQREALATCEGGSERGSTGAPLASDRAGDPDSPVFAGDFADPTATIDGEIAYVYSTQTPAAHVPVGTGTIPEGGSFSGDAIPDLPDWTAPGFVWAPSVLSLAEDDHRLYYTTRDLASGRQCISVAFATELTGPFVDESTEPFVCQLDEGGSIDASTVVVDDTVHLVWKSDGNCCGLPTWIYSAPLDESGAELAGEPVRLIRNDQPWEGPLVEAPSMAAVDGGFLLLYSANDWDSEDYAVGWARCETVAGPCTKPTDEPLLATNDEISGPGGVEMFRGANDELRVVYHAWLGDQVGYDVGGVRALFVERLAVDDGVPSFPARS